MARRCTACGQIKDVSEFAYKNKHRGQLRGKCKKCQNIYQRQHYQENKTYYLKKVAANRRRYRKRNKAFTKKYLSEHPCVDCGESDIVVLEFDHVRGKKIGEICKLAHKPVSLKVLKIEISKCAVRCANCHRRKHYKERKASVT